MTNSNSYHVTVLLIIIHNNVTPLSAQPVHYSEAYAVNTAGPILGERNPPSHLYTFKEVPQSKNPQPWASPASPSASTTVR